MELKIRNLTQTYPGGVQALNNISLTIPNGMFGLLGPNGAGKSTLMRIIATLQTPDSGTVQLDDLDVLTQPEEIRKRLGYLPQNFGLDPKISALDLLTHFTALKGISKNRKAVVEQLLHQTNLFAVRNKKLGSYSGGMKQRFGIAQALIGNPQLIIVDEPTAGLDPQEQIRFHNLLSEIGEHVIVILSTHIVRDVSGLCTRVAIIDHGQVLLESSPQQAVQNLKGHIFATEAGKNELPTLAKDYNVISTKLFAGRHLVRIHHPGPTPPGFEPAQPDLDDVYFHTLQSTGRNRANDD